MQYKPKSIPALHIALGGLPSKMRVEADPDIGVSVKTVGLGRCRPGPEFGDNNTAGSSSRKRSKGQQG